ncbi:MAG: imidazole glycerol phosphate synthase subunit HisH [Leadbetterella sp.]
MEQANPDVTILKYNAGNIMSVIFALQRLGASYELTDDFDKIKNAKRIIFPGVGEAGSAMKSLKENGLNTLIPTLKQPFLGTCVGMQLLCLHSEESDTECLGIFDVQVKRFPKKENFKVPHTGWNSISDTKSPLFEGISNDSFVYYNHSYYAESCEFQIAKTDFILPYAAALHKNNFYACQFHSEISGKVGSQIFRNFLAL